VFRLGDNDIFRDFPHSFDGMKLEWVPDEIANTAIKAGYKECDIKIGPRIHMNMFAYSSYILEIYEPVRILTC